MPSYTQLKVTWTFYHNESSGFTSKFTYKYLPTAISKSCEHSKSYKLTIAYKNHEFNGRFDAKMIFLLRHINFSPTDVDERKVKILWPAARRRPRRSCLGYLLIGRISLITLIDWSHGYLAIAYWFKMT